MNKKIYYKFQKSINSLENIRLCQPFQQECLRLSNLGNRYTDIVVDLYEKAEKAVVRREYSVKGESIERGYYAPSPVIDIVVGNLNRGKLLKHPTKRSQIRYIYGFDKTDRLVTVKSLWDTGNEIIVIPELLVYEDNKTLGITFASEGSISAICEEIYKNNMICTLFQAHFKCKPNETCIYHYDINEVFTFHKECYAYDSEGLCNCNMYDYEPIYPLLKHYQYRFKHDSEGYLSEYTVTSFEGEKVKKSIWDNHVFKIETKRRI